MHLLNKGIILFILIINIFFTNLGFSKDLSKPEINEIISNMEFEIFSKSEWVFLCEDHRKKNKIEGDELLSDKSFIKTLENFNRKKIYKNIEWSDFINNENSNKNLVKYEIKQENDDYFDVTKYIYNHEKPPCERMDDRITYQTKPVSIIRSIDKCTADFRFDDKQLLKILDSKLKLPNFDFDFDDEGKIIIKGKVKEFLDNDVKLFSVQNNGFRCINEDYVRINVKNINEYIKDTTDIIVDNAGADDSSTVTQSNDEPEIASCDTFDIETLREKVNSDERSDCADVLIQEEEEIRQQKIIEEEITLNKSKLTNLFEVLNNTNLPEVINQKSFADFEEKIESLKDDLENLNEIQIIDDEFTKLNEEINNLRLYFDLFDSYRGICDDETSLNSTDKSNYVELCDQIKKLDNDINNDLEAVKEYIANRKYLLSDIDVKLTSLEESIQKRKDEIKAFKELAADLEKEKNSIIESIRGIKFKQDNLIKDINAEISKLESQNNTFDKTKDFFKHINFAEEFQNDNFDLEIQIENIIKKIDDYKKDDKKILYNEVETLEEYINDTDILINNYKNEYDRYENNLLERQNWQQEQDKINKEKAEKKAAEKLLEKQERENEKIKNTINEIKIIEDKINQLIRDYKNYLESSYSEISNFNKNFDPTDTNVINFDAINKEIKRQEKIINKTIIEYSDLVTKLPKDYDAKKFNFNSIKELSKTEERFKIKLEDINDKELNKLNTQIDDAKFKIDTREDRLGEIVTQTTEELSKKDKLLETTVNELSQREELIIEKKNTIEDLQNEIEKLKDDIKFEKNLYRQDIGSKNMIIYLLIGLSIILSGSLIYFIIRKKPTSNNNSENYISKIDELEKKLENEIKQSRLQANSQKIMTEEPVIAENKKREPSLQEIKNENLKKLYEEYNDSMKNPNLIEKFQTNYNAIGLERESKISTGRNVRLRKVNTSFDRAIFWVVEHDNKLLVFGGRMLKVQAPSLLANDGTMARDLLQGIFELQTGPDLRTHKCAVVRKNNQIYEVIIEGTLQLPKID